MIIFSAYLRLMQPTIFINHGGGPCFFLRGGPMRDGFRELEAYLDGFAAQLAAPPRAILVVSGHWEEPYPTVNAAARPPLLYDYWGFPDYTYRLTWPAPGAPEIAARVQDLLTDAGIDNAREDTRGWDHGVFVPLKVMWPDADIPTVQLSLCRDWDPARHLAIGRALRPLRDEGVLILGSGQTYHNLSAGFGASDPKALAFDTWLRTEMVCPETRDEALIRWASAPGARHAQPEEDHLLPLMVVAGAASGDPCRIDFHGQALGKPISGFRFGA